MNQSIDMVKTAYHAIEEKKGEDIRIIDISKISILGDYFIIASGSNDSQINAIVENVEEKMSTAGYQLRQREGYRSGSWVLLDYSDVVIHIFDTENRLFYDLERIWNDGTKIDIDNL